MAFGKHSLLVNTMIKGKIESLSLKNLSSPVFIFHNGNKRNTITANNSN